MSEPKSNIDYCHMINEQAKKLTALRDEISKLKAELVKERDFVDRFSEENAKLKVELGDALELLCNTQDELKKEMLVTDYYASDIWDICEDEVSGQQRSCIDNSDDDGGEIFGGKRARQRQKERDQSILK